MNKKIYLKVDKKSINHSLYSGKGKITSIYNRFLSYFSFLSPKRVFTNLDFDSIKNSIPAFKALAEEIRG